MYYLSVLCVWEDPERPCTYVILVHVHKHMHHTYYCLKFTSKTKGVSPALLARTERVTESMSNIRTSKICIGTSLFQLIVNGGSGNDQSYGLHDAQINTSSLSMYLDSMSSNYVLHVLLQVMSPETT